MNRETINKVAAILAIVSGVILVVLLMLTAPSMHPKDVISWKFVAGFVFIAIGIFSLRIKR